MGKSQYGKILVIHLCISHGYWGVERYVESAVRAQIEQGITAIPIGNTVLEEKFLLDSVLLKLGILGRIIYILKLKPDVIHAHMTKAELLAYIVSKLSQTKLVSTRHFAKTRGSSVLAKAFSNIFNKACTTQISVSEFVKSEIEFPNSLVIYPGTSNQNRVSNSASKSVIMLQRLSPEKRTEIALFLWKEANLRNFGWKLDIYGDGSEMEKLNLLSNTLQIYDSVIFHGQTSDTIEALTGSSIFLASCPNEHFGLSTIEAMSLAIPVVIPQSPSSREILGELSGECSYIFGDNFDGSRKLNLLGEDYSRRVQIGLALQKRQQDNFSTRNFDLLRANYRAQ